LLSSGSWVVFLGFEKGKTLQRKTHCESFVLMDGVLFATKHQPNTELNKEFIHNLNNINTKKQNIIK
jgi:hypothetical protein